MTSIDQRFLASITLPLSPDDQRCLQFMLRYLGRSNLWPSRWYGEHSQDLHIVMANEAERFVLPLTLLHKLYQQLRSGQAINWNTLPRER